MTALDAMMNENIKVGPHTIKILPIFLCLTKMHNRNIGWKFGKFIIGHEIETVIVSVS